MACSPRWRVRSRMRFMWRLALQVRERKLARAKRGVPVLGLPYIFTGMSQGKAMHHQTHQPP